MARILLLITFIASIQCSNEKNVLKDGILLIPVSNRCEGCVREVVKIINKSCRPDNMKIIFTSMYSRGDFLYVQEVFEQKRNYVSIDSTNQYSSIDKVSVYPVLYDGDKKVMTINPNGFDEKLMKLERILHCGS